MTRVELNDFVMASVIGSWVTQGHVKQAVKAAKIYEKQRDGICELCGQPITECKC